MRYGNLSKLLPLTLCIAFAPVQAAVAADPSTQEEATAEEASWLAAVSASRLAGNGTSLSGRVEGAERRGRIIRNGRRMNGRNIQGNGGMTVVSMELPGGARHAK